MDLQRALARLDTIGVTSDVLLASRVDPTDPGQVRAEVETLLASALAENAIVDMRMLARLQQAFFHLLTEEERRGRDALSKVLRAGLVGSGVVVPAPARFEACLEACPAE